MENKMNDDDDEEKRDRNVKHQTWNIRTQVSPIPTMNKSSRDQKYDM
jgi:hypothetical protein